MTSRLVNTSAVKNLRMQSPDFCSLCFALCTLFLTKHKVQSSKMMLGLRVLDGLNESRQRVFRIAIKHACYRLKKQRVLQTGESFALATLQDDY